MISFASLNDAAHGKTALVLAPDTDDGEFGCGGTIARVVQAGRSTFFCATCQPEAAEPAPPRGAGRQFRHKSA